MSVAPAGSGRIGSPAPLWRVASPRSAVRVIGPFSVLLVAAGAYLLLTGGDSVGARVAVAILGGFAGLLGIAAVVGWMIQRRMSGHVAALAAERGWRYDARADPLLRVWSVTVAGRAPRIHDAVAGAMSGLPFTSFDYRCVVGRGECGVRVAVVDLPHVLPAVELTPWQLPRADVASLPSGPSAAVGAPAVAAVFHVVAPDPRAVAALLTPSVVELLVSAEPTAWRIVGDRLIALWAPESRASTVDGRLRTLAALAGQLAVSAVSAARDPRPAPAVALDPEHYAGSIVGRWRLPPLAGPVPVELRDVTRDRLADGRPYVAFGCDRPFSTAEDQPRQRLRVIAVALPAALPLLEAGPESPVRVAPDIEIENDDFNRAYRISAVDRKYAVDVLNPRAVEALMAGPPFEWRIEGNDLVGFWPEPVDRPADASLIEYRARALGTVARHIPAHVWSDFGWSTTALSRVPAPEPPVELPGVRPWHVLLGVGCGLAAAALGALLAALVWPTADASDWLGRGPVLLVLGAVVGFLAGITPRIVHGAKASTRATRAQPAGAPSNASISREKPSAP